MWQHLHGAVVDTAANTVTFETTDFQFHFFGIGDIPSDIPTLSEWALIVFAVLIVASITYVLIRRRRRAYPASA
jgi:hypothetical protein